jgi:branched-chain amino acid aminotransferase
VERAIDRGELYAAQEVFFTGTAVGVAYVASVDRRPVGDGEIGPITKLLSSLYARIVTGREQRYLEWLTPAYASARVKV